MFKISLNVYRPRGEAPVDYHIQHKDVFKKKLLPVMSFQLDHIKSQLQG